MLTKIADVPKPCANVNHNPPNGLYLPPGVYQHVCPACGATVTITVTGASCSAYR